MGKRLEAGFLVKVKMNFIKNKLSLRSDYIFAPSKDPSPTLSSRPPNEQETQFEDVATKKHTSMQRKYLKSAVEDPLWCGKLWQKSAYKSTTMYHGSPSDFVPK